MSTFSIQELNALFGFEFSERQLAAITSPLEPSVVMAGAGSGKTSVMAARIVWLVANQLIEPEQVLGLTFTNKAAGEFRARVRQSLSQLDIAPTFADAATITTYHAFAQQLLRDDGIRIGLEPEVQLLSDVRREQLALTVVRNPRIDIRRLKTFSKSIVTQMLKLDDVLSDEAVDPAALRAFDADLIARFTAAPSQQKTGTDMIDAATRRMELTALVEQFRETKIAVQAIDYSDMVRLGLRLVTDRPDVVQRLRMQHGVVLLDEYQDTSVAQRLLMTTAFGDGHPVMAVGDALQAIYEWRGASAQNITLFPEHFPRQLPTGEFVASKIYGLPTTQRFGERIASLANDFTVDLRAGLDGVEALEAEPDCKYGIGSGIVAVHPDSASEFAWLAQQLGQEREHTPWGNMAVLLREMKQAGAIYEALTAAGIPAQIVGKQGLLEIPDIAELVAYLRVIHEPAANPSWVRILTGMRYRLGVRDLVHLGNRARTIATNANDRRADTWQEQLANASQGTDWVDLIALEDAIADPANAPLSVAARERIAALRDEVRTLRRYAGMPLADLLRVIIRETGLDIELAASDRAVDRGRRAAVEQFIELASNFESLEQSQSLSAFLQWLSDADQLDKSVQLQPTLRRDAVSIMTIHAAKGLQRDVIALPAMIEGSFPSLQSDGTWPKSATSIPFELLNVDVDPALKAFPATDSPRGKEYDEFQDLCRPKNIAEETRLAYVAVTRAHRRVIASAARTYPGKPTAEPSRFLLTIRDACEAGLGIVDMWAEAGEAEAVVTKTASFPQRLAPAYAERLRAAIAEIESPSSPAYELTDAEAAIVAAWDAAIEHHREERTLQRGAVHDVPLPVSLTTTQVQSLDADAEDFLLNIVRPMPKEPTYAAKRGSAFHTWVESFFETKQLALDDEIFDPDEADLEELQARFMASEWSKRKPDAQELPFTIGIGAHSVRGRIDAVYRDGDGYVVVDWKTNKQKNANTLQLAIYRAAVATRFDVPVSAVRACFFYVVHGETVWADDDVDLAHVLSASVLDSH